MISLWLRVEVCDFPAVQTRPWVDESRLADEIRLKIKTYNMAAVVASGTTASLQLLKLRYELAVKKHELELARFELAQIEKEEKKKTNDRKTDDIGGGASAPISRTLLPAKPTQPMTIAREESGTPACRVPELTSVRRTDRHMDRQTDGRTDGRTDGQTETPSYRDAMPHLKNRTDRPSTK